MTGRSRRYLRGQGGYTLVEVIIASAIGAILMGGLTSVIMTSVRAGNVASSRIETSSQIRSFQFFAYDDFARSSVPSPSGCGTVDDPCTTEPIELSGQQVQVPNNTITPVPAPYDVSYTWDGASFLDRQSNASPAVHAAVDVTQFSWYVDGTAPNQTVVVSMTVTVRSYSESQTLRFYPRVDP
jgi:prepilin-type N-terminal cleavage/methylation domain-containing protein